MNLYILSLKLNEREKKNTFLSSNCCIKTDIYRKVRIFNACDFHVTHLQLTVLSHQTNIQYVFDIYSFLS